MARFGLWRIAVLPIALLAVTAGAAVAPGVNNTVQVAARLVSFLKPPVSGPVTAAVIYEQGDQTSESEARSIERALGPGLMIGSVRLRPKLVATSALEGLTGARVAFVTRGTNYRAIATAAASRSILTISSDPACTRAGYCVVAISSPPRVQITVSKAASKAANLKFSSGFLMLVKEI